MPIYEYQCGACGHKLEKLQKISDDLLKDCPSCSEAALTKLVSAAAFRLKGNGWYETDFKNGSKKNVADGEGAASPDKPDKSDKSDKSGKSEAGGSKDSGSNSSKEGGSSTNSSGGSASKSASASAS